VQGGFGSHLGRWRCHALRIAANRPSHTRIFLARNDRWLWPGSILLVEKRRWCSIRGSCFGVCRPKLLVAIVSFLRSARRRQWPALHSPPRAVNGRRHTGALALGLGLLPI